MRHTIMKASLAVAALSVVLAGGPVAAQQITNEQFVTSVDVLVLPFAEITVTGSPLLYLEVPPGDSTLPFDGVDFTVTGNGYATVVAEPDGFVTIPTFDFPLGEYMGRAELNGVLLGYRLELHFPVGPGGGNGVSTMPGDSPGATGPRTANLAVTGGARNGRVHMAASADWTPGGGLPPPGVYVGGVTLTVTAN